MIRTTLLVAFLIAGVHSTASAAGGGDAGTPAQRAACGPAVRKYCYMLKANDDVFAYQRCLQSNRAKIGQKCQMVLDGQL